MAAFSKSKLIWFYNVEYPWDDDLYNAIACWWPNKFCVSSSSFLLMNWDTGLSDYAQCSAGSQCRQNDVFSLSNLKCKKQAVCIVHSWNVEYSCAVSKVKRIKRKISDRLFWVSRLIWPSKFYADICSQILSTDR